MAMTIKIIRVRLLPTWKVDPSDRISEQMTFDLRVDDKTMMPIATAPVFGVVGPVVGEECYPVVLRRDGIIDYGNAFQDHERFVECNLLSRKAEIGELVTYTALLKEEYVYQIASIET